MTRLICFNKSAVVLSHDINLSILNPIWLTKEKVLSEEEATNEKAVFSPNGIAIPNDQFDFTVLPDRLQVKFDPIDKPIELDEQQAIVARIIGGIATKLHHTNYIGMGINLSFFAAPDDAGTFSDWNKRLFATAFRTEGEKPRYGSYNSAGYKMFRMKVDAKPVILGDTPEATPFATGEEAMKVDFNFHVDLQPPINTPEFVALLARWSELDQVTTSTLERLFDEGTPTT